MKKKLIISLIILFLSLLIFVFSFYFYSLTPVSKISENVIIEIPSGTGTSEVISILKKNNLIRNEFITKVYTKLHKTSFKAGNYHFDKNYKTTKILDMLNNGEVYIDEEWVTLVEGKTLEKYVTIISSKMNFVEKDFLKLINDKEYLKELIDKYWFLTDDILDGKIYYGLEGYLFPDTYSFDTKSSMKEVIERILNNTDKKLTSIKSLVDKSDYNIHEILTIASITELEGNSKTDRDLIAGILHNRLDIKMSLGCDVTTYYAAHKELGKDEITYQELNDNNAYNTRNNNMIGLPIGPICNPSLMSIEAVLNPTKSNYLYFFADKNGNVYYSKTLSEHQAVASKYKW